MLILSATVTAITTSTSCLSPSCRFLVQKKSLSLSPLCFMKRSLVVPFLVAISSTLEPRSVLAFQSPTLGRTSHLRRDSRDHHFYRQQRQRRSLNIGRSSDTSVNSNNIITCQMSSTTTETSSSGEDTAMIPGRPTWQQTMLRIKDPERSLKFYCDNLGMTLMDTLDFPQYKFGLYFLTTLPKDAEAYSLTPGTQAAHDYLWNYEGVTLELTHNYGTESDDTFQGYHPGNGEKDGFGHIAVSVNDVYATSDKLLQAGFAFKKKPDEGRMKGTVKIYGDLQAFFAFVCPRALAFIFFSFIFVGLNER